MLGHLLCWSLVLFVTLSTIAVSICILIGILPSSVLEVITAEQLVNEMVPICIKVTKRLITLSIIWAVLLIVADYIYKAQEPAIKVLLENNGEDIRKFIELLGIVFNYNEYYSNNKLLVFICLFASTLQYVVIRNNRFKMLIRLPEGD